MTIKMLTQIPTNTITTHCTPIGIQLGVAMKNRVINASKTSFEIKNMFKSFWLKGLSAIAPEQAINQRKNMTNVLAQ